MNRPPLGGHGFGLRVPHYAEILARGVRAELAEALTENFLGRGGRARAVLERLRRDIPITLHGVSLSIGSTDPLSERYLSSLVELCERCEPALVSDHLCFGTVGGRRAYDLWPLPYTEEALAHVVQRVAVVQERLGRQICLENVSSYVEYRASALREWEFLSAVAEQADCLILLDVNNVFVSAHNHGFSADDYLAALPRSRVAQLHLAGHRDCGAYLLDDHGSPVSEAVWELYRQVLRRFGPLPTILEWDENVPSLTELEAECDRARAVEQELERSAANEEIGRASCRERVCG